MIKKEPSAALMLLVGGIVTARILLLQIFALPLPFIVYEGHHWRQAFTYGVAWNFAHTTLDVFHPRNWVELATSNVVPMEFPLYPLLASLFLRFGDSVVGPRLLSLLSLLAMAYVLWTWCEGLAERASLLVALALAPMVAIEFRSFQPEPLACGFAIGAAFFIQKKKNVIGAVLFGLSLLAKPLGFGILPGLVAFAAWDETSPWRANAKKAVIMLGLLSLAAMPMIAWDRWAAHLLERDLHGEWLIQIEHTPSRMFRMLMGGQYSRDTFLRGFATYATSWWLVPAAAFGLYRGLADRAGRRITMPMLVWASGYAMELMMFGERLHSNAYYFILAAPPMAWFTAQGLGAMVRFLDAKTRPSVTITRCALALVVLLPLGFAMSKSSPWENTEDEAQFGFERNRGVFSDDLGFARITLVLVLVMALGPRLRPSRVSPYIAIPYVLGLVMLGIRPLRDEVQYFRYYTAADKREDFAKDLAHIRKVFADNSSKDDRILVAPGGTYKEPPMVYFYYALRNGFALRDGTRDPRSNAARLYFQVEQLEQKNHVTIPGPMIDRGPWWRITCIAPDRCGRGGGGTGS